MEQLERLIGKLILSRLWLHVLFCVVFVFVFAISVLLSGNKDVAVAAMVTCLYVLFCTYLGRWCGKYWLSNGMYSGFFQRLFSSVLFLSTTGASGAGYLYKGEIIKYFMQYLTVCFPLVALFICFGVAIALARHSVFQQVNRAQLLQQQKESELRLLLSQLSPHFLFNTLNNIYGISLIQQQRVPALLLKLSELLRYSVYETREPFISLQNELLYIQNYIEFEKIQTGEKLVLTSKIEEIRDADLQIAPMLLIVFVENAFKYSKLTRAKQIFVSIHLYVKDEWIYFNIMNSYDPVNHLQNEPTETSGVGLHHALKRLKLIYGKDFFYNTSQENGTYEVQLSLKTSSI